MTHPIKWLWAGMLATAVLLVLTYRVPAADLVQRGWVNDFANVLTVDQVKSLSTRLSNIEKTKPDAPQVVVVTYNNLYDQTIGEMTIATSKAWKIGRKERDNGILIAVAPQARKYFISVGYGLEPFIPDSKTQAIGDKMRQALSKNSHDWNAAIVAAVDAVESNLPSEAYDPANPVKKLKPLAFTDTIKPGHTMLFWIGVLVIGGILSWILYACYQAAKRREQDAENERILNDMNRRAAGLAGSNTTYHSTDYYRPRSRDTTIIVAPIPSSSSRRDDDDYRPSRSSSSDSSPSDNSSSGSDYSSGGGDFGGGGGGGDL